MARRLRSVPDAQPDLDGNLPPPDPAPEPTAGDLVRAWIDAYTAVRGSAPHPALIRRVSGLCRSVGRDCATLDDWRAGWRAATMAGRAGRYDVIEFLSEARSRARPVSAREAVADMLMAAADRAIPGEIEQ